jgi:acyl-CoA hydrolase
MNQRFHLYFVQIHNLLTNRPRDTLCIPASKTVINTIEAMHVQERNVHNKIFGGTLMRMSYEIAVTCAFNACAVFPVLVAMDDVSFVAPVEIGSILNLRASVTYICTERKLCFVVVEASMINTSNPNLQPGGQLLDKQRKLTNECHFAFRVDSKLALPQIVPESYGSSRITRFFFTLSCRPGGDEFFMLIIFTAEILSYLDSRRREADLPMLH